MRCWALIAIAPLALGVEPAAAWQESAQARSDRVALIVAADAFEHQPTWALPALAENVAAVQKALAQGADIPKRFQRVLRGEQVSADAVSDAIFGQARRLTPNGLLLIHWIGHGWVDSQGRSVLFTYRTDMDGAAFTRCVTRDEIAAMTDSARAVAAGMQTVFVADVCRIRVGAPPPIGEVRPLKDWEVYATKPGAYTSIPDQGLTPFSRSWSESLLAAARNPSPTTLDAVFDDLRMRIQSSDAKQEPQLVPAPGATAPVIARQPRIRVQVTAVDLFTRAPLPTARIAWSDGQGQELPAQPEAVLKPGAQTAAVSAPGYLTTRVAVDAVLERSGMRLELPVHPAVAVVCGTFSGSSQPVEVTGAGDALIDGVHALKTQTNGSGFFRLLLPDIRPGMALRIAGRTLPLPEDPTRWPTADLMPGVGAPTLDLSTELSTIAAPAGNAPATRPAPPPAAAPAPRNDAPIAAPLLPPPRRSGPLPVIAMPTAEDGRWPGLTAPAARMPRVNGDLDLSGAGTPTGLPPNRFLVALRARQVLDASGAGTPRGAAPDPPAVPVARERRTIDLAGAGTARGLAPLDPAPVALRQRRVLDLAMAGTPTGLAPLTARQPQVERNEMVVDLGDAGTPAGTAPLPPRTVGERSEAVVDCSGGGHDASAPFDIPEALRQAMAAAVRP